MSTEHLRSSLLVVRRQWIKQQHRLLQLRYISIRDWNCFRNSCHATILRRVQQGARHYWICSVKVYMGIAMLFTIITSILCLKSFCTYKNFEPF